jgi:hypothetical protein
MKRLILPVLILVSFSSKAQIFYVQDEGNGVGAPIRASLVKSLQIVTELPNKAEYIVKTMLERNASIMTRPKMKIMVIDANTGITVYETPLTKFTYSMYTGVEAGEEREAKIIMEKYGTELILTTQKSNLEAKLKKDSLKKG